MREAEAQAVTQLVLGESHRTGVRALVGRGPIETILRRTRGIDVHVVADPGKRWPALAGAGRPAVHVGAPPTAPSAPPPRSAPR